MIIEVKGQNTILINSLKRLIAEKLEKINDLTTESMNKYNGEFAALNQETLTIRQEITRVGNLVGSVGKTVVSTQQLLNDASASFQNQISGVDDRVERVGNAVDSVGNALNSVNQRLGDVGNAVLSTQELVNERTGSINDTLRERNERAVESIQQLRERLSRSSTRRDMIENGDPKYMYRQPSSQEIPPTTLPPQEQGVTPGSRQSQPTFSLTQHPPVLSSPPSSRVSSRESQPASRLAQHPPQTQQQPVASRIKRGNSSDNQLALRKVQSRVPLEREFNINEQMKNVFRNPNQSIHYRIYKESHKLPVQTRLLTGNEMDKVDRLVPALIDYDKEMQGKNLHASDVEDVKQDFVRFFEIIHTQVNNEKFKEFTNKVGLDILFSTYRQRNEKENEDYKQLFEDIAKGTVTDEQLFVAEQIIDVFGDEENHDYQKLFKETYDELEAILRGQRRMF